MYEAFIHVVNTLAPVFLLILFGAMLRKGQFVTDELLTGINRLSYWVALPFLLFTLIAKSPGLTQESADTLWVLLCATGVVMIVAVLMTRLLRLKGVSAATFLQAGFRGNLAFVGLPVVLFAFSSISDQEHGEKIMAMAALSLAPLVVIYNIVAVTALLAAQHRFSFAAIKKVIWNLIFNPLLVSCVAGLVWVIIRDQCPREWNIHLPTFLSKSMSIMGSFAIPAALLCIGGKLVTTPLKKQIRPALFSTVIKIALGPAAAFFFAWWFGVGREEQFAAMLLMATPTAVASYVLVEQLNGDTDLAASAVGLSTILSLLSLCAVVAMM